MRLPNGAILLVEGHMYAAEDQRRLGKYALWCACAEEHSPYYHANSRGLTMWCPLDDADPIRKGDLAKAGAASAFVAGVLGAGRNALVTCAMGLNRSALVAGLALRQLGMDGPEVVDRLRRERGHHALCNKAFEKAVLRG